MTPSQANEDLIGIEVKRGRLLDRLLEAGSEQQVGRLLVEDLRRTFEACAAWTARITSESNPLVVTPVASEPALSTYFSQVSHSDPLLRKLLLRGPCAAKVARMSDIAKAKSGYGRRLPAFMRFMNEVGWGDVMEAVTSIGGRVRYVVAVARGTDGLEFSAADQTILSCKLGDAETALEMLYLMETAAALKYTLDQACMDTESVIVLLNARGRPVMARGKLAVLVPEKDELISDSSTSSVIRLLPAPLLAALKRGVRRCRANRREPHLYSELVTLDHRTLDLTITRVRNGDGGLGAVYYAIARPRSQSSGWGYQDWTLAAGLTRREREIMSCVARGLNTAATAEKLGISPWTVRTHLRNIYEKTGVHDKVGLVARIANTRGQTRSGRGWRTTRPG